MNVPVAGFAFVNCENIFYHIGNGVRGGFGVVAIKAESLLRDVRDAGEFLVGEVQVALDFAGESGLAPGQVDEVGDSFERIVDLVGDGGGEPSDRCESLAGMERSLKFLFLCD